MIEFRVREMRADQLVDPDRKRFTNVTRWLAPVVAHLMLLTASAVAQNGSGETYTPEELQQHFQNVAQGYRIQAGRSTLTLRKRPLMHWQNSVRQQEQGAIFAWEKSGRPYVLASIFTYQLDDRIYCRHEVISLADKPLKAVFHSESVWSPQQPGLQWKPVDGVAAPTESAARRLTKMRSIARQFSGTLSIPDSQPNQLDLIPQPLIRYESPDENVIDGAIFSLAVATDPEIFLVIEARKAADGSLGWHYAASRSHYQALSQRRHGQLVWTAAPVAELASTKAGQLPWANDPYFIFTPSQPLPAPKDLR